MRIEQIDVFHVVMPMKAPWRTAFSEMTSVDSVLVRMVAGGKVGWGESSPYAAPQYCTEFAAGAFTVIRNWLGPTLLGREVADGKSLQSMLAHFKGNQFAKAALDIAWWDAFAQAQEQPLWQAIGGQSPRVSVGADIAVLDSIDELLDAVGVACGAGFKRIKLKFRKGWGPEMVRSVRAHFPKTAMHIDCNSGFTLEDAKTFHEIDQLGLVMIEQPLGHDDLLDHATLQESLETPICLDESIVSIDRARKAIAIGACRWINLKVGRLGGLTPAIMVHDYCRSKGIPCWVGGMLESAVGQGPSIALATLDNIAYPADIFPTERLYAEDLSTPDVTLSAPGEITAPERPGHGFAPVPERLQRLTVQHARLSD